MSPDPEVARLRAVVGALTENVRRHRNRERAARRRLADSRTEAAALREALKTVAAASTEPEIVHVARAALADPAPTNNQGEQ